MKGAKIWQPRCVREQAAIDDLVPLVVGDLLVGNGRVGAGAVDEHIDLAEGRDRGVEQRLHREPLVGRDGQERRLAAEGLDRFDPLVAALFAAAGDDDLRAGLGEALAQRAAEDAGAADDDGDLVVEAEEFRRIRMKLSCDDSGCRGTEVREASEQIGESEMTIRHAGSACGFAYCQLYGFGCRRRSSHSLWNFWSSGLSMR